MKFVATCCLTLLPTTAAFARWSFVPTKTLLQQTDLIVEARLTGVKQVVRGGTIFRWGTLTVQEGLRGRVRPGDTLRLEWDNPDGQVCPTIHHEYEAGKPRLWLLQRAIHGAVRADYPGRVLDPAKRKKLERLLKTGSPEDVRVQ